MAGMVQDCRSDLFSLGIMTKQLLTEDAAVQASVDGRFD
jgi:hypothetical protein